MSTAISSVKATKKSAFSCEPCRKRKVKCGGEKPSCNRCAARDEECVYKLSPTLSYTQKLENRIEELEELVLRLRSTSPENRLTSPVDSSARLSLPSPGDTSSQEFIGNFEGLKLDDEGSITYHGPTSFFQLPTDVAHVESPPADSPDWHSEGGDRRERLVNNAWQQRVLETLADTPEPFQYLLNLHWCWIQPLFNFIYRPAFTRDMEVMGPYYSHMLLNAVLGHSIRWGKNDESTRKLLEQYEGGALFGRQARLLLFENLTRGHSKIPTVQTLLLLSAHECGLGNRTQAWLYSGMSFRLIEDMGICIDGQRYAGSVRLSDEDIEIRHRLFWSCYFWDKMISLYLGRSPTLQHSLVSPPQLMLDDSAEDELWSPHGIVYPDGMEYPATPAHSISCFMRMCRLSVIFNQILIHIYDPVQQSTEIEIQSCLEQQGAALKLWWAELPDFLRIDARSLPPYCPPSHIVTLNCLYHTFNILLYRPMLFRRSLSGNSSPRADPNHLVECISSATSIIAIFDLFCRFFGYGHCVLSLSYSVYTAASIFLLQIQAATSHDEQALRRLEYCINNLERVKGANPVIGNAARLLTQALSKLGIVLPMPFIPETSGLANNYPDINLGQQNFVCLPVEYPTSGYELDMKFQMPPADNFGPDGFGISPEVFESFASLEPLSANVDGLQIFR